MPDVAPITVRYFALVREQIDIDQEDIELPRPATVGDLWAELVRRHPDLDRLRNQVRTAVDLEFVVDDFPLNGGEEVALVPPIAGGASLLTGEPIVIDDVLSQVRSDSVGGTCVFIGTVRDSTQGKAVERLVYEAYAEMAEKKLAEISAEVESRWPDTNVALQHRLGELGVGEVAVVIAAAAPHREEAFAACRHCIERIKEIIPIFKKELGPDGVRWVGADS